MIQAAVSASAATKQDKLTSANAGTNISIDANGVIRKIKVLKDPGHGFAQAAVAALDGITCVPANANGKNCAVRYRYPVKFTLS